MHRRVVQAAQTQILTQYGSPAAARAGWMLRSPRRLLRLWLATLKAIVYGGRWLLNEYGLRWVLSPRQRQRVRTSLIELAIVKGLDLQKRVERIEEEAARTSPPLVLLPVARGGGALSAGRGLGLSETKVQGGALHAARLARWLRGG